VHDVLVMTYRPFSQKLEICNRFGRVPVNTSEKHTDTGREN